MSKIETNVKTLQTRNSTGREKNIINYSEKEETDLTIIAIWYQTIHPEKLMFTVKRKGNQEDTDQSENELNDVNLATFFKYKDYTEYCDNCGKCFKSKKSKNNGHKIGKCRSAEIKKIDAPLLERARNEFCKNNPSSEKRKHTPTSENSKVEEVPKRHKNDNEFSVEQNNPSLSETTTQDNDENLTSVYSNIQNLVKNSSKIETDVTDSRKYVCPTCITVKFDSMEELNHHSIHSGHSIHHIKEANEKEKGDINDESNKFTEDTDISDLLNAI